MQVIPSAIFKSFAVIRVCSTTNVLGSPKYYSYTTSVTLSPIVLRQVLCGSANPSCSFTLPYSERFQ